MFGITLFVFQCGCLLAKAGEEEEVCTVRHLDAPIAEKDGDFIIAGMFQIGKLQYRSNKNGTQIPVQYCSYEESTEINIQKALTLRMLINRENDRFKREFNKTLGYEIYDTCTSSDVSTRAAVRLVRQKKVIGFSGVDNRELIKRSASFTTSYHIPTFVYMYNDDELMNRMKYPTLFSMIDTEVGEAEITIRFLEKMGYKYMDIWYHKFSQEMAEHIHNHYVKKVGCGRLTEVTDHLTQHVFCSCQRVLENELYSRGCPPGNVVRFSDPVNVIW